MIWLRKRFLNETYDERYVDQLIALATQDFERRAEYMMLSVYVSQDAKNYYVGLPSEDHRHMFNSFEVVDERGLPKRVKVEYAMLEEPFTSRFVEDWMATEDTVEIAPIGKARDQNELGISRAPDQLTLDAIAVKLGLSYEEAISAMVRAKHKPPEAP